MGIDIVGLDEALEKLDPSIYEKSFVHASNDVIGKAFTKSRKEIISKFNIKMVTVKDIKGKSSFGHYALQSKYSGKINKRQGHLRIYKATRGKKSLEVHLKGEATALYLFDNSLSSQLKTVTTARSKVKVIKRVKKLTTRERNKIQVKVKRGEGSTTLKHAFKARMKNGHIGIFERSFDGSKMAKKNKQAIFERTLHSPANMFDEQAFFENIKYCVDSGFKKRFMHHWDYYNAK